MSFSAKDGAILITTLWILSILSLLSIGVAGRMGLELKLAGFYRDDMKALYLAKAAIERIIYEKDKKDELSGADMLSESWANNKDLFNNYNISGTEKSSYTVKYVYKESLTDEGTELYGMMDEASRIDINKIIKDDGNTVDAARKTQLVNLLQIVCGLEPAAAEDKVNNLIDWMDSDDTRIAQPAEKENEEYQETGVEKYCKNRKLDSIEELLLVKGFDSTILYGGKEAEEKKYGIIDYITIYTEAPQEGKVNVNTAPEEVLEALGFPERLAKDIINYRKNDTKIGEPENQPIKEGNINIDFFKGIFTTDLEPGEEAKISNSLNYLTAISSTFRINVYGKVNRIEKHITSVVTTKTDSQPIFKYWAEE